MSWWDDVPPERRQEGDLAARMPAVYEAVTGEAWATADPGTRARVGTDVARWLSVADDNDPARDRLAVAQEALVRIAAAVDDAREARA